MVLSETRRKARPEGLLLCGFGSFLYLLDISLELVNAGHQEPLSKLAINSLHEAQLIQPNRY